MHITHLLAFTSLTEPNGTGYSNGGGGDEMSGKDVHENVTTMCKHDHVEVGTSFSTFDTSYCIIHILSVDPKTKDYQGGPR